MRSFALSIFAVASLFAALSPREQAWNAPQKPFRIADNLYYVGTADLAVFLVTTPKGSILINSGLVESAPIVLRNMETLGFKPSDVRYLLNSQAHYDHVAGTKALQDKTGAKVISSVGDAPFLREGKYPGMDQSWPPVKVDRELRDGDIVELGGMKLTARITPGHTAGCTTWTFTVNDNGRPLRAVILGGYVVVSKLNGNKQFPTIIEDYRKTFRLLETLPCDLFLAAHASQFQVAEKLRSTAPDRFVDPAGYRSAVASGKADFERAVAKGE